MWVWVWVWVPQRPPRCHCHRQAATAITSNPAPPLHRCHCCANASSTTALPPPLPPPCSRAAHLRRAFAAAGLLPPPTLRCHISLRLRDGSSLGALWELSGSSMGALWELVAVAGIIIGCKVLLAHSQGTIKKCNQKAFDIKHRNSSNRSICKGH